jgi:hydroxyacylglutathione hydrolase
MVDIIQIINSVFASNTFVIYNKKYNKAWLIDIGDFDKIMSELSKDVDVSGVFITHYHHDHIFGINSLIQAFPNCNVYISENGVEGLYSDKVNLSYYYDEPIIFKGSEVNILRNCDRVLLFEDCFLEAISTPGHNWSCMTYKMNNYLFTGDSFIPNTKVVTKLKGGDVDESRKSLIKIMKLISEDTTICPGHGEMITGHY